MSSVCLVYITCRDVDEARNLAKSAVEKKLAACANIHPNIESVYWWDKKIESSIESLLILKTANSLYSQLEEYIKSEHSYTTPCILKLPVDDGNLAYLTWIQSSLNKNESF